MSHVVKYSETIEPNTIKCNNILIGNNTTDYGPTSVTNFYAGIDPSSFSGYTVYLAGGPTDINARYATTDNELILIAREYGGININSVEQAITYFVTGSTNTTIINTEYPSIVTSGLTFNFDAGFLPSYPKNGIKWYDVSGNNKTATGTFPDFTNETIKSLLFNGESHTLTTPSITTPYFTIELWVKSDLSNVDHVIKLAQFIIGREGIYRLMCSGENSGMTYSVAIKTTNNTWYSQGTTCGTSGLTTSNDYSQIVATYDGNYIKMYSNGEWQGTGSQEISGTLSSTSGTCWISYGIVSNLAHFKGNLSIARIYNRGLTYEEVLQNYNVTKSRFGL